MEQLLKTAYGLVRVRVTPVTAEEAEKPLVFAEALDTPFKLSGVVVREAGSRGTSAKEALLHLKRVLENSARFYKTVEHKTAYSRL